MLKIEQQADLSAKRESLKKLSLLCHSISGLPNVYTIFIYRKRTPFSEKRPYYWLGYGLRWLCGTTIPFVMLVYDYIPLMSPVSRGKKRITNACPYQIIRQNRSHFVSEILFIVRSLLNVTALYMNSACWYSERSMSLPRSTLM